MRKNHIKSIVAGACIIVLASSCKSMAMSMVADSLTGEGGTEVFTGDNDPQLIADALPFAIKMYETLLSGNPEHSGLLLTTGSLFVMYANAFVQGPAEMLPPAEYQAKEAAHVRAQNLYLRGVAILRRGMEVRFPGFMDILKAGIPDPANPDQYSKEFAALLKSMKKEDVPLVYWTVAGSLAAFSLSPMNVELGLYLHHYEALINQAYRVDPDFNAGALDELCLLFYGSLPPDMGGDLAKAEEHFRKALEKSDYQSAGAYVSYAETITIPARDYAAFKKNLNAALAINPDAEANRGNRLVIILAQQKARYLLDNANRFFLDTGEDDEWSDGEWSDEDPGDGDDGDDGDDSGTGSN